MVQGPRGKCAFCEPSSVKGGSFDCALRATLRMTRVFWMREFVNPTLPQSARKDRAPAVVLSREPTSQKRDVGHPHRCRRFVKE